MVDEGFKRKLTAILSADVIGYSRLMRDDEEATVREIAAHRILISEIVKQQHGRVVDSPGDNILAEFASVVDAVNCAIKIQNEIKRHNTDTPKVRRMDFRIGINLGDVIEEEGRIYGDGVNIAARVEGLASAGRVAISGTVYEHIKDKLSLGYHYLGEQDVKNIPEPIRVYRLLTEPHDAGKLIGKEKPKSKRIRWAISGALATIIVVIGAIVIWNHYFRPSFEPALVENMKYPLPDKPSVVVLPFDNLSGDASQDYIADGISENIINTLSHIPALFVIARHSSFTYKGKPVKIKQVSEELGVRYVLEGSVLKSGDEIRITTQLIDSLSGGHIWSGRYDRDFKNFFDILDEITLAIAVALQVNLTEGEQARIYYGSTRNFEAWSYVTKGMAIFLSFAKEAMINSRELFKKALDMDPNYTHAMTCLAWTHLMDVRWGYSSSGETSLKRSFELSKKSKAMDENQSLVHSLLEFIYLSQKQYDRAIEEGRKAIALGPSNAQAHAIHCETLFRTGFFEESVRMCEKAIRLQPHTPLYYLSGLSTSYYWVGRYEDSLAIAEELISRSQKAGQRFTESWGYWRSITAKIKLGRESEAREDLAKYLELRPGDNLELLRRRTLYKPEIIEEEHEVIRQVGFPEHAPLPLPDKPSIAVLAFDNLSGNPEQEYFVDGMTDDLITDLSKISGLFVIARHSAFQYKGKALDVKKISRELGIRYVLKGSVRRADNKIRINAQLIDTTTGGHLWAERYDREQKDLFKLQNEILNNIVTALDVKLVEGEQAKLYRSATENPKAYDVFAKGFDLFRQFRKDANLLAQHYLQKAIELDPEYAEAMGLLGTTHWANARYGWSASRSQSIEKGKKIAEKALRIDSKTYLAMSALSLIHLLERDYDRCMEIREQAFSINPNSADSNALMAFTLSLVGKEEEALPFMETAMRLSPFYPSWYLSTLCDILRLTGRHNEAIATAKAIIELNLPHGFEPGRLYLAAILIELGREEEARGLAKEYRTLRPTFSLKGFKKSRIYEDPKVTEKLISQLRRAGFPE